MSQRPLHESHHNTKSAGLGTSCRSSAHTDCRDTDKSSPGRLGTSQVTERCFPWSKQARKHQEDVFPFYTSLMERRKHFSRDGCRESGVQEPQAGSMGRKDLSLSPFWGLKAGGEAQRWCTQQQGDVISAGHSPTCPCSQPRQRRASSGQHTLLQQHTAQS